MIPVNSGSSLSRRNEKILLLLILAVAACFRLYSSAVFSLSNDELSALTRARFDNLSDLITKGIYIDFHPAGVQLFIYFWIKLFGDSVFMFRLPFVLCGLGSVYLIYAIGKRWFTVESGLVAAAFFASLQFSILYSFFARMYSPGAFFSLLAAYSWTQYLFAGNAAESPQEQKRWWWMLLFSMIACVHIHYFSFVFAAVLGLAGLVYTSRQNRRSYLLMGALTLLSFVPELPIFKEQMKTGDIGGWLAPPEKRFLLDFYLNAFNNSPLLALVVAVVAVPGLVLILVKRRWKRFHSLILFLFLFTFALAYGYSVLRAPVIQYSTLFFVFPFVLLLFATGFTEILKGKSITAGIIILVIAGTTFSTIAERQYFNKTHYGVFKEIAASLKEWSEKYGTQQVPAAINVISPAYIEYYFRQMNFKPFVLEYNATTPHEFAMLSQKLDTVSSDYFVYAWSNAENINELNKLIRRKYPVVLESRPYFNSAITLFAKKGKGDMDPLLLSSCCDFEKESCGGEGVVVDTTLAFSGRGSAKVDSTMEFGVTIKLKGSEIPGAGYRWLTLRAMALSFDANADAALTIQIDRNGKTYFFHSAGLKNYLLNSGKWYPVLVSRVLPDDLRPDDELKFYIWNKDRKTVYVDDFCIEVDQGYDPYKE